MSTPVSGGQAVKRLQEITEAVGALAEREEEIARVILNMATEGELPPGSQNRARARADTIMKLAGELRAAVGLPPAQDW